MQSVDQSLFKVFGGEAGEGISSGQVQGVIDVIEDYRKAEKTSKKAKAKSKKKKESDIEYQDLVSLGFVGKEDSLALRTEFGHDFHLGYIGNAKRFLKELRALGIQKEEMKEWKKKYDSK